MRPLPTTLAAARAWRRRASTSAAPAATNPPPSWLAEVRRYTLHPAGAGEFLAAASHPQALALRSRLPFAAMWTTEAGGGGGFGGGDGISLQTVTHLYLYSSAAERAAARAAVAGEAGWGAFLAASRPFVSHQAADLYAVPAARAAALLREARQRSAAGGGGGGGGGEGGGKGPAGVFELVTGDSVKNPAGLIPTSAVLLSGVQLVGGQAGSRMLLYRHDSLEACLDPRLVAGKTGGGCRALLRPVAWSPLQ